MNVQAFYSTLARLMSERTDTEIKVKEITENGHSNNYNERVQRTCA